MNSIERRELRSWACVFLGAFLAVFGSTLAFGGVWLMAVGGSAYYLPAGAALLASGILLILRRRLGAWLYFAFFAVTCLWALWEAGLDGRALMARLFAFFVLLLLVIAVTPLLTTDTPRTWRPALTGIALVLGMAVIFTMVVVRSRQSGAQSVPLPTLPAVRWMAG